MGFLCLIFNKLPYSLPSQGDNMLYFFPPCCSTFGVLPFNQFFKIEPNLPFSTTAFLLYERVHPLMHSSPRILYQIFGCTVPYFLRSEHAPVRLHFLALPLIHGRRRAFLTIQICFFPSFHTRGQGSWLTDDDF